MFELRLLLKEYLITNQEALDSMYKHMKSWLKYKELQKQHSKANLIKPDKLILGQK